MTLILLLIRDQLYTQRVQLMAQATVVARKRVRGLVESRALLGSREVMKCDEGERQTGAENLGSKTRGFRVSKMSKSIELHSILVYEIDDQ